MINNLKQDDRCVNLESLLLDSRLITGVKLEKYNYKIVQCGSYVQVYFYDDFKVRDSLENAKKIDVNRLTSKNSKKESSNIELRNLIRAKLNCQMLAKANID